ncbi:hydroxymethylpyrimidine/phosphomethylpyrimidine kinase [Desulforamulus putei DSM 12395]|uniref:Hydroxymethylpyrimidine/phosphomethylpyrimidine kinase n=1 Tax=Desulforamulus putei DSM 12395 TaxID=1121429 RepID=A0A1M4Z2I9_9FIRM|nr:bifunctional hydroxymethylpyrimidine kinase/phosphomethylpyrimidine kinase [Desulforamulus putei]SHF12284.1 hydroxymethylpyrimidine/phosphomethylpyrimidine kinase [Desulforamulus putei DSM 12395]
MKNVLTIAGSDSCGGAGIQADLKTFSALGTYGMSAITAVTAQNTTGVFMVKELDVETVAAQINCIYDDIEVHAVKIGMVSSSEIIETIGRCLMEKGARNIVVDPVMVSKSKYKLLRPEACAALVKVLLPLADVVTPNIPEAEELIKGSIGTVEDMKQAAREIYDMGPKNVIIKGGHLAGDAVDVLYDGRRMVLFEGPRIATRNTHGTGCTFSSAIAAYLARGYAMKEAVGAAKEYITTAIAHSLALGRGAGPTHHFYSLYKKAGLIHE